MGVEAPTVCAVPLGQKSMVWTAENAMPSGSASSGPSLFGAAKKSGSVSGYG